MGRLMKALVSSRLALVDAGLTATVIEAPDQLQTLAIPTDHSALCLAQGSPTVGNCAGQVGIDVTNVSQCVWTVDPDPVGAFVGVGAAPPLDSYYGNS